MTNNSNADSLRWLVLLINFKKICFHLFNFSSDPALLWTMFTSTCLVPNYANKVYKWNTLDLNMTAKKET